MLQQQLQLQLGLRPAWAEAPWAEAWPPRLLLLKLLHLLRWAWQARAATEPQTPQRWSTQAADCLLAACWPHPAPILLLILIAAAATAAACVSR
jgi:hypothetical protein